MLKIEAEQRRMMAKKTPMEAKKELLIKKVKNELLKKKAKKVPMEDEEELLIKETELRRLKEAGGISEVLKDILRNQIEFEEGLLKVIGEELENSKNLEFYVEDLI